MGVEELGGAEAMGAEEGFDAGEGVGEFVGVAEGVFEEVVLGLGGEGGEEFEGEGDDGGGGREGVEVGVEEAEEGLRIAGGVGDAEFAEVEVAIVEGEGEVDGPGGALGGGEAGGEGVEGAAEEEEEGFEGFEGILEFPGAVEVLGGAVEGEEAVVFAVEDVVEAGGFGAEAFGESLAGEGGKVAEGVDAPEKKKFGIQNAECGSGSVECGMEEGEMLECGMRGGRRFQVAGLRSGVWVGEMIEDVDGGGGGVGEGGGGEGGEGGEMGEVGGGGEGEMEGGLEDDGFVEGGVEPVLRGDLGVGEGEEVEGEGVWGGEFEVGGEGGGEGEEGRGGRGGRGGSVVWEVEGGEHLLVIGYWCSGGRCRCWPWCRWLRHRYAVRDCWMGLPGLKPPANMSRPAGTGRGDLELFC